MGIIKSLLALFIHGGLCCHFAGLGFTWKYVTDVYGRVLPPTVSLAVAAAAVVVANGMKTLMPVIWRVDSAKLALYELPFQRSLLSQIEKSTRFNELQQRPYI